MSQTSLLQQMITYITPMMTKHGVTEQQNIEQQWLHAGFSRDKKTKKNKIFIIHELCHIYNKNKIWLKY